MMVRACRIGLLGFWLAGLLTALLLCWASETRAQAQPPDALGGKNFLILHALEANMPLNVRTDRAIMASLEEGGVGLKNQFYEYLDLHRHPDAKNRKLLAEMLRVRYDDHKIDAIITLYPEALQFVLDEGRTIFPDAPIVALYMYPGFEAPKTGHRIVQHVLRNDIAGTFESALKLVPAARGVYVVSGVHPLDKKNEAQARLDLQQWQGRLAIRYVTDMSLEEMLAAVSGALRDTIILYLAVSADNTGRTYNPRDVAERLSRVANGPVFGLYESLLGHGIVGGSLVSYDSIGTQAGQLALSFLQIQSDPNKMSAILDVPGVLKFDWRELKRWNLSVDAMPAGSIIMNREYTLWERYGTEVIVTFFVLVAQALLIVSLVVNRAQRQQAERKLAEQLRIETLLAELSARFVSLPTSEIENEIHSVQRHICETLALDRSTLWQVAQDEPGRFQLTHVHTPPEAPSIPTRMDASDHFPWSTEKLLRGETLTISTLEALPPEAARDRESFHRYGTKSTVVIPLTAEGAVLGVLSFATTRAERAWSDNVVKRFRMVAEMMANAIVRARADMALQESRARLTLAAASADARLWEVEAETERVWLTEPGRVFFGVAPDETLTLDRLTEFIHPEDREAWRSGIRQALQTGQPLRTEFRAVDVDGSAHWFASQGRLQGGGAGRPNRLLGVTIDITERRHAEEALRESEARFRNLADTAPVLVWMAGVDKRCTYFNRQWLDFTGRTLAQELGTGWAEGVHPEERARCLQVYATAFDARQAFDMEYRLRRADGAYRWIEDRGIPRISPTGQFLGYIGSCIDITERKHGEERLRASEAFSTGVLASLPGQMVIVDRGGAILRASESWPEFAAGDGALDPTVLAVGVGQPQARPWAVEQAGPVVKGIQEGIDAILTGARAEFRLDYGYPTRTEERWASISILPLRRPEGGAVIYRQDITLQQRSRLEVERLRRDLTHVGRVTTMGEMAAALAHELNQPLTAILSNAHAGERYLTHAKPPLDEIREILQDVAGDARRAGEVIQRLRSLLRKEEARFSPLDVNQVIREMAVLVHTDAILRNLAIDLELAPDLSPVRGDRVQLQQVLLNLVLNGMEAVGPRGDGKRIVIRTQQTDAAVCVAVRDQGPGIPTAELSRVFEMFYTTKASGMGMGLAISRSIVEAHGGRIWAENNPDRGATFSFAIPACPPEPTTA
jgi:PAS domain S-box-containing protein